MRRMSFVCVCVLDCSTRVFREWEQVRWLGGGGGGVVVELVT